MNSDPINEKTIITTNKYKIEISKNEINIFIRVVPIIKDKENEKNEKSFFIEISDFSLIDSYFNVFQGNTKLIYKHLVHMFNQNLFIIEKDKYDNEKLVIKIDCLKENKKEYITINLDNLNSFKIGEENDDKDILEENDIDNSMIKNYLAAPIASYNNIIEIRDDNDNFFYYKNKEKNNEYNLFIYKKEIKNENYKEIIFKIIERSNQNYEVYYAFLNLVDFLNISEYYFSQFNYSIDAIYDDLLLIFSNHNYKIEKSKNYLKTTMTFFNTEGKNKTYIARSYINTFKIEPSQRNMREIIDQYFIQLIKYIKKFGEDINNEKFKKLIKVPNKYIYMNEKLKKNKEKRKNEIKNINDMIQKFDEKDNINNKDIIIEVDSIDKVYNKNINIINDNIIINNKKIVEIYNNNKIKSIENKNSIKKLNSNFNEDEKNSVKEKIKLNNKKEDLNKEIANVNIEKTGANELIDKNINNNKIENLIEKKNDINEEKKIIALDEQKEDEKEKGKENEKEKEKEKSLKKEKKQEIKQKIKKQKNEINNNISKQNKENILKNLNKNINENTNPFFLNRKRIPVLLINPKNNKKGYYEPIEYFINEIISRRKRLYNNNTLLKDSQLMFLLSKLEKTNIEFRFVNLQIHAIKIFTFDISQIQNNLNDINIESKIINDFYQKTKNKKNLIFLIKTKNNKSFGGFSECGFNGDNINDNNNNINSTTFVFSLDKMKIYDFIGKKENPVIIQNQKLPEFKNQIFFENNNLKIGYTGNKNSGFLIEEDYELNDGKKRFEINQIQVISLKV